MTAIVWVNVTTLMSWVRPAVGVVRVEQEYVRWLLSQTHTEPTVKFVVFHPKKKAFYEVSAQSVQEKLARRDVGGGAATTTAEDRFKYFAKRLTRFIPPAFLPKARDAGLMVIRTIRFFRGRLRQLRRPVVWSQARIECSIDGSFADLAPAGFGQSDVFISMGLDWDQLDLPVVYRAKQRHGFRVVLMCYDAIPVLFPHLVVAESGRFGAHLVELGWCADHVMCISQSTRRDFAAFLEQMGGHIPMTSVIRLGDQLPGDSRVQQTAADSEALRCADRPFVLYVSTIERRKNHELLYRAWVRMRDHGIDVPRLIFVGMPGWGVSDFLADLRLDHRIAGDIVVLNQVSDGELHWLYEHCLFTLYPSLYEGWGLPVTESLAHGKFCLCSTAASIPEAGGSLCEYLDPWDLPTWVDRISTLIQNPHEVASRNARVRQEFVPQKWTDTAFRIHEVATALCPKPPSFHSSQQSMRTPGIHCD